MEMPEGWKNLNGLVDYKYSGPPSYERTNLIVALSLMKEMAEALKLVSTDLINSDLGGLEEARIAYQKFKEWK